MDVCQPPSIAAKYLVFHLLEIRAGHDFPAILHVEILDIIKDTALS